MSKPKLFIGSSVEGLSIAYAIQENLRFITETTVWDQGVFNLSESSLESLVNVLEESDFGVFIFTPDDYIIIRGKKDLAVRDNVLFELGLFVGRLGRKRAFIVIPDNQEFHLPTDLIGMTPGKYEAARKDKNMQAGTGSVSHKIREQIQKVGLLNPTNEEPEISNPIETKINNDTDNDIEWIEAIYVEKDYEKASIILKKKIRYTKDIDAKVRYKGQQCYIHFKKDPIIGNKEFEKLISEYPSNSVAFLAYANNLYSNKSYNKALEIIEIGINNQKRIVGLTNLKADCYWVTSRKNEAIELLKNTLKSNQQPDFIFKLHDFYVETGDSKEAYNLLKDSYLTFPDNESIKFRFAKSAYEQNKKEISLLLYKELIGEFPTNSTYWCLLGNSYLDLELNNLALVSYEKAAGLSKEGWIYGNIGNLYNNKQLFSKAEENLKIALSLHETSDYHHNRLSSVYTSMLTDDKKVNEFLLKAKAQLSTTEVLPE
jgi:tetratricopeptide (TPR) repeat protein